MMPPPLQPPSAPQDACTVAGAADAHRFSAAIAAELAACALCVVTSLAFFLSAILPLPVLLYFPLQRRFGFGPQALSPSLSPAALSIDFYGRSLFALLCGTCAALFTHAVATRLLRAPKPPQAACSDKALSLGTAYALSAFVLTAALFAYKLSLRNPLLP